MFLKRAAGLQLFLFMNSLHLTALSWKARNWNYQSYCALKGAHLKSEAQIVEQIASSLKLTVDMVNKWLAEVDKILSVETREGADFVTVDDPNYPEALKMLRSPPMILSCLGETSLLNSPGIGVVGARNVSHLTELWLERELGSVFEDSEFKRSWTLISGGAHGVDMFSHRLALTFGIPSIVVLPTGLRAVSPKLCKEVSKVVIDRGGLVVSMFSPDQTPQGYLYHLRNEVLVGLSRLVVIAQAGSRSGTMVSANFASDLGKSVNVIPGHPLDDGFVGSLQLIRDGAHVLCSAEDLVCQLSSLA